MTKLLHFAGGALLFAFFLLAPYALSSKVSVGQEATQVCPLNITFDDLVEIAKTHPQVLDGTVTIEIVAAEDMPALIAALEARVGDLPEITRAMIIVTVTTGKLGMVSVATEIDGCLQPPFEFPSFDW